MARARNITIEPEFFLDDDLASLSPLERLAFIGLCTVADDEGCIRYKPNRLKVQILPYEECDFELILNKLEEDGFIFTFRDEYGDKYLEIDFAQHQYLHRVENNG